jgi:hypothetical protein
MALMSRPEPMPVEVMSALPALLPEVALELALEVVAGVVAVDVVELTGEILELME